MAKFPGFIGGSYESQALTADCSRTVNWFPEVLQDKDATAPATLLPSPGVERIDTELAYKVQPGRAHVFINGREFAVLGRYLLEIDGSGGLIPTGAVRGDLGDSDGKPATISSNGDGGSQLFITASGNGWVYDLTLNTLTQIAALNGRATMGAYLDGYFLCLDSATSTLLISALMNGATWTPGTDFAQRSLAPDKWVSMCVVGRNLWLYGEQTSEVWYDTGGTFPFRPHPSGLINLGCAAPWSVKVLGAEVVWLATSKAGHTCVARASGFSPSIISTYPMETAFQSYNQIGAAVADSYSQDGHTFYLLNFDFDGATWAWDATTTLWSERGTWVPSLGRFTAWRPRFFAFAFNEHRTLDAGGPGVYRMGTTLTRDVDGQFIRRLRRAPAIMSENKRVFYKSFDLDLEPGLQSIRELVYPDQPIVWTGEVGCSKSGANTIIKTVAADAWDAGAFGVQQIIGNSWVKFTVTALGVQKAFGLTADPSQLVSFDDDVEYGFKIDAFNRIRTILAGASTDTGIDAVLYDVLKVEVVAASNNVIYSRNGVVITTASVGAIAFPLSIKGSLYSIASSINDAMMLSDNAGTEREEPQVMLRLSNDGGRTWLSEEMRGSGRLGEYLTRVGWNRLGAARRRVFEIVCTDSIPWRLTGAYLESKVGDS